MSRQRVVAPLRAWPLLVVCVAVLLNVPLASAAGESWARLYPGYDNIVGVVSLRDGKIGVVAEATYFRLSAGGDVEVQVALPGGKGVTRATSVIALPGDRLLVTGFSGHDVKNSFGWLCEITADGVVEWERSYRYLTDTPVYFNTLALLGDGNLVVGGSVGAASLIMRLDARGAVLSQKTYDFPESDRVLDLVALPDRSVVATCWTKERSYVLRIDERGEVRWCSSFAGGHVEGLALDATGNVVATGVRGFGGAGDDDALIISFHPDGAVQWAEQVGGPGRDQASAIVPSSDGTLWISGISGSSGNGGRDGWLLNIDPGGRLLSQTTVGTESDEGNGNGGTRSALALARDRMVTGMVSRPESGPALLISSIRPNEGICTLAKRSTASVFKSDISFQPMNPEVATATLTAATISPAEAFARVTAKEICSTPVSLPAASLQTAQPSPRAAYYEADPQGFFAPTRMLINRKFAELDALETKYLRDKSRDDNGTRNLTLFYRALTATSGPLGELTRESVIGLFRDWLAHSPRSPAATIALAGALFDYAGMARGSGFGNTVTGQGWKSYEELSAEANIVLARGREWATVDPQYFSLLMWLRGASGVEGSVDEAFQQGLTVDRTYLPMWRSRAQLLLPKWSGDPTALAHFADAAGTISGERGDTMYAIVALEADWSGPLSENRAGDLAGPLGLSWPRVRKGLVELATRYPRSDYAARLACIALGRKDKPAFREAVDKLHLVWKRGINCIPTQKAFDDAVTWLRASAAAVPPVVGSKAPGPMVEPRASARAAPSAAASIPSVPGPVPFVEQPISKWPTIVLRNHLELQGGTIVTDFASFILRLKDRDVLVTSSEVVPHQEPNMNDYKSSLAPLPPTPAMILQGKLLRWSASIPGESQEMFVVSGFAFPGPKTARDGPMTLVMSVDPLRKSRTFRALSPRLTPMKLGERVFAVGCLPAGPDCRQTVVSGLVFDSSRGTGQTFGHFRFQPDEPSSSLKALLGAPVLDDTGAVAAVVSYGPFDGDRPAYPTCAEIGIVLKKAAESTAAK